MSGNGWKPPKGVSQIRTKGDPNSAITVDGFKVTRQDRIFFKEAGRERIVVTAPYDNHFVYLDPSGKVGRWFAACTCGSLAVIVGYKAYTNDMSPTQSGELMVCFHHVQTGLHADGSN